MNRATLIGRLGADPEVRRMSNGDPVVNLRVVTSETWKDRQTGERKEKAEWHRVIIFNTHLADIAERYLRKGSQALLEGSIQTRKWTDKNGHDKYATEIVMQRFGGQIVLLGGKPDGESRNGAGTYRDADLDEAPGDLDDSIPF